MSDGITTTTDGGATILSATSKIDRAWSVLIGAALCMICSQPASILFTFGIISPEIIAATGWSKVAIAGAIGPGAAMGAIVAPLIGRAADKFGVRKLVIFGGLAYGLGLAGLGFLPQNELQFLIFLGLAGALGFAAIPILYAQLMSGWFTRRRGLALALVFSATSVGVAFWSIYASILLPAIGWRGTYAVFGLTSALIISGAGVLLIRDPPAFVSAGLGKTLPGMFASEAVRTATFWKITVLFILMTAILAGTTVTLPLVLTNMGLTPVFAASVIPAVGIGMFIGRLSAGVLLDRFFAPHVTAAYTALTLVGMLLMLMVPGPVAIFLAAGLLGMGIGAEMDAAAYMISRAFGLRFFGTIYGLVTLGYGISGALGVAVIGSALVSSVAAETIMTIGLVVLVAVIALLFSIRPRHFPFEVES
jgi:MFS family permease